LDLNDEPVFDAQIEDPVDHGPPPEAYPPRRGGGRPKTPAVRFAPIFFVIAAFVGIERVSMLMFVMRDPSPTVLAVAGTAFISVVMTVAGIGAWQFGKYRRAQDP
jgi:hypothetical protein